MSGFDRSQFRANHRKGDALTAQSAEPMSERLPGFRARPEAIYHRAIDLGIVPRASTIAARCGLTAHVVRRALNGYPVAASTMAAMTRGLDAPVADLFAPLDEE